METLLRTIAILDNKNVPSKLTFRIFAACCFLVGTAQAATAGPQLPEGPGKEAVQRICSGCHAPEIVMGRHETKDGWEQIVGSMVEKGANGTDDEFNQIIDYLAAHFPKKSDEATTK